MNNYQILEEKIIDTLKLTKIAVLATADKNGVVSACQMCIVNDGLTVYFQTDSRFDKIKNIGENNNVAVNCGAFYFKGKAEVVGKPCDNAKFVQLMKEKHLRTYESYTNLPNEVLIKIELSECKIWGVKLLDEIRQGRSCTTVNFSDKTYSVLLCDKN